MRHNRKRKRDEETPQQNGQDFYNALKDSEGYSQSATQPNQHNFFTPCEDTPTKRHQTTHPFYWSLKHSF